MLLVQVASSVELHARGGENSCVLSITNHESNVTVVLPIYLSACVKAYLGVIAEPAHELVARLRLQA